MQKTQAPDIKERVLIITRIFDAPKELLWKAWTQPEAIKLWWGPRPLPPLFLKLTCGWVVKHSVV